MSFQVNSNNAATYVNSFNLNSSSRYGKRIKMYAGQTLPTGHVWCDGNHGTPNLTGKFIYGTTDSSGDIGNNTIYEMPAHSHNINVPQKTNFKFVTATNDSIRYKYLNVNAVQGINSSWIRKRNNNDLGEMAHQAHNHIIENNNSSNANRIKDTIHFSIINSNTNINSAFDVKEYPNINSDGNTSSVDFNQRHVIIGFIMEI